MVAIYIILFHLCHLNRFHIIYLTSRALWLCPMILHSKVITVHFFGTPYGGLAHI